MTQPSTIHEPYHLDLGSLGNIEGLTFRKDSKDGKALYHYFGGLKFAQPPVRWRVAKPLPSDFKYSGKFTGEVGTCPQIPNPDEPQVDYKEDCLQLNVYIPAGEDPPSGGWPVFVYIHGGFLQVGSANEIDPKDLLSSTPFRAVVVSPGYRLNLLGFLSSSEIAASAPGEPRGNLGFWDQRLALEWIKKHINLFNGDPQNITIAGYSAGSHCVMKQLQYDLYLPQEQWIVNRAIMWSNGPGMQPKTMGFAQEQFDELLEVLNIPSTLSPEDKVSRLRATSSEKLQDVVQKMKRHQFRAILDGDFNRPNLYDDINSGDFARRMRDRGITLLTGECKDEWTLYAQWFPPTDSFDSVAERLRVEYPTYGIDALLKHYYPNGQLPEGRQDWPEEFGHIYADLQVHMLERGFIGALEKAAEDVVFRYRVEWRAKDVDSVFPPEMGVTHSSDFGLWVFGGSLVLQEDEKPIAYNTFVSPLIKYVKGDINEFKKEWGTKNPREVRKLNSKGEIEIWKDTMWDRGQEVWQVLRSVGATGSSRTPSS